MKLLQEMLKMVPRGRLEEDVTGKDDSNPVDTVTVDVPLLIRIMEYAREDAKTDMDLHTTAERLIKLSQQGKTLTMDDYPAIVGTVTESARNAWENRMKKKGATEFKEPRANKNTSNEFVHALKDEDGKKIVVGKFSYVTNKEISEASLGSKIEYSSYAEWKKDLPKGSTFHKDEQRERAQALGKDFEGVAGTWNSETKSGWIYSYYLNKKNLSEAVKSKTFAALEVQHNPDNITVLVKSNEETGEGYHGISVVFYKFPLKRMTELVGADPIADEEIKRSRKEIIDVAASRVD